MCRDIHQKKYHHVDMYKKNKMILKKCLCETPKIFVLQRFCLEEIFFQNLTAILTIVTNTKLKNKNRKVKNILFL